MHFSSSVLSIFLSEENSFLLNTKAGKTHKWFCMKGLDRQNISRRNGKCAACCTTLHPSAWDPFWAYPSPSSASQMLPQVSQPELTWGWWEAMRSLRREAEHELFAFLQMPATILKQCSGSRRALLAVIYLRLLLIIESLCLQKGFWTLLYWYWTDVFVFSQLLFSPLCLHGTLGGSLDWPQSKARCLCKAVCTSRGCL